MKLFDISDSSDEVRRVTQVFVHGYEGVRSEQDIQRLTLWIRRAKPAGRCLLLCWGDWLDLPSDEGDVLRRLANTAETITRDAWEGTGRKSWIDGFEAAASETLRFWSHAAEAEQYGSRFARELESHGLSAPLRIWGHSLGARLLLAALSHPRWNLPVELAVMMGAAADIDDQLWGNASQHVSRMVNVYSSKDLVLRIAPLWNPVAGLRPVRSSQVENIDCGYQHYEYWSRFDELLMLVGH